MGDILSDETLKKTIEIWEKCGRNATRVSEVDGMPCRSAVSERIRTAKARGYVKDLAEVPIDTTELSKTHRTETKLRESEREKKELMQELALAKEKYDIGMELKGYTPNYTSYKKKKGTKRQAVAIAMLSDVHAEERIKPETCGFKNELTLDITSESLKANYVNSARVANIWAQDIQINELVCWIGGDIIHGNMSKAFSRDNFLQPKDAILWTLDRICDGIKYYLDNTKFNLSIIFSIGNHGRSTDYMHYEEVWESAWEAMLYDLIVREFRTNSRVNFPTYHNKSYYSVYRVFDYDIRFHHGDAIRYAGGIGGPLTGSNKAIMKWNKEPEDHVHLDIHGHYHTLGLDNMGVNICSNGSIAGYGSYALRGQFGFEHPKQGLVMIDSEMGKSVTAPIWIRKYEKGKTTYL